VALSSATGAKNVAQTTNLVENVRSLLSPFAKHNKDEFAKILDLVNKLAGEASADANTQQVGSRTKTADGQPSTVSAKTSGAKSSVIPDELAYGLARGQFAPGTSLPVRIGWNTPTVLVRPEDMPQWDGRIPPGVPAGSVPFYTDSGHLTWFGLNGKMYDSLGRIEDNSLVHGLAQRNDMTVSDYITTIRAAVTAAGRPLTLRELYAAQAEDIGGRYATYEPVVTPEAERAAAALASRTSPFGYGVGQIVPGTGLPARIIGDGTSTLSVADMPVWDGRTPERVPAGSIPFYSTNGALLWLAGNGKLYDSSGMITDNVSVYGWANRNEMSVDAFLAALRTAGMAAGRALTLAEVWSASVSSGSAMTRGTA
jgi:hypothetical protein